MHSAWHDAITLLQQGDAQGARERLASVTGIHAEQDFLQGVCAHALQDIPQAVSHFAQALQHDPGHSRAAAALGALLAGLGRHAEAEHVFRQSLARSDDPQVRFNLAVILEDLGQLDAALAEYTHLISHHPDDYAPRHNRAGLHARRMQLADAATDYRELVKRHPGHTLPWQNLADIEISQGHYEAALGHLDEVLRREPGNAKAVMSAAIAAAANGDFTTSDRHFEHLRRVDAGLWQSALERINGRVGQASRPEAQLVFLVRAHEHLAACDWSRWPLYGPVFRELVAGGEHGELISLAFRSVAAPLDAGEQRQLGTAIARQVRPLASLCPAPSPSPARLRVGYLGARFGHHATGVLLQDFFAAHDHDSTDVFLLDLAGSDGSTTAQRIRQTPGVQTVGLQGLDDSTAATRIAALGLDILVDLSLYNDDPRPGILAQHPAAVQVAWLAAPYTSGAPWLDYVISDARVSPGPGWSSEAEVQLPESYFVFSHASAPPAVPLRERLGLPDNRFVFACLSAPWKIDPDTFTVWMRILQACPDSVLWLLGDSAPVVLNLKREAEWRGIDPRRLLFAPRTTPEAHLARLGAADLFLDTRYCNGHTTVAEALWAGLPVLTCPGPTFASRVAGSLLHSCHLPELVCADWAAYEQAAVSLYRDRAHLVALRQRLHESRHHAAPFDLPRQARHLEKAFRHMRERFAQGQPAAPFAVSDLA